MRFSYRAPIVISFAVLLCSAIQAGQPGLRLDWRITDVSIGGKAETGTGKTKGAFAAILSEPITTGTVSGRTLSSEGENVLLLLLGLFLLLVFTTVKLQPSKNAGRRSEKMPAKTD